jgi:hypothetical protein
MTINCPINDMPCTTERSSCCQNLGQRVCILRKNYEGACSVSSEACSCFKPDPLIYSPWFAFDVEQKRAGQ